MKSNRINYLVVGSFVIVIVISAVVSMALLAGRTGATDTYYTVFRNVLGIGRGTQVLYQGYRVGQVEGVELERSAEGHGYRVELSIARELRIPEDSRATIATGLLSAVTIDIQGGVSEATLEPGEVIASREAADVFAALSGVAGDVQDLMENSIRPILLDLNERMPEIAANLEHFSVQLAASGDRMNDLLAPANTRRIGNILDNADAMTEDARALVNELRETRRLLDEVVAHVDGIIERNQGNVDQALLDFQYSLGSVARHIEAINQNLEGTSRNMNEFSRQIRGNPALLLGGEAPSDDGDGGWSN